MADVATIPGVSDGGFAKTPVNSVVGGPVIASPTQPAAVQPVPAVKAEAVPAKVEAAPSTGSTIKDLMLARANQFKKETELKAREAALAKSVEPKADPAPVAKVEAKPADAPVAKVEAAPVKKEEVVSPEDSQWQTLWNEESAKEVATLKADPKFKALSAMGVAEMVPARMLSHYKEKGEFISAAQVAEQYQKEILDGATAVVTAMGFKLVPLDATEPEHPVAASTAGADLKPEKGESYTAFQARKAAASDPAKAPVTLSNRPTDLPAPKPAPDAKKPLPGESYVKYAERMRKAGTPVGESRA